MGLFGFGKKKEAAKIPQQREPEKSTSTSSSYSFINGTLVFNGENLPEVNPVVSTPQASSPEYKIFSEDVDKFLARNGNAKLVKLTGKPDEFADYTVGNRCHIEEDEETEGKYNVTCGGDVIGRLPASAISYAEKHDTTPDCLVAIVASVDYDYDKDRDIISIYIAD